LIAKFVVEVHRYYGEKDEGGETEKEVRKQAQQKKTNGPQIGAAAKATDTRL
jgi:hypothetical protein